MTDDPSSPHNANPYAAPEADTLAAAPEAEVGDDAVVAPQVVAVLRQTAPWVTFASVVAALLAGGVGLSVAIRFYMLRDLGVNRFNAIEILSTLTELCVFAFLSLLMFQYARRLRSVVRNPTPEELGRALRLQRNLWRVPVWGFAVIVLSIFLMMWAMF